MRIALLCCCYLVLALTSFGCNGNDDSSSPPPVGSSDKPTFDWGYPQYSEYDNGKHVGTNFYQQDPKCQERLTFYECEFVNAKTPDNMMTNPTGASGPLTGGMDSCTAAIEAEAPSYCIPADICNPAMQLPAWAPGQASTDNLAWQLFIALNWPADPNQPGYPDTTRTPGALNPSGNGHAEVVWLDYPTPEDLFGVPSPCDGATLSTSSKVSNVFLSKDPPRGAIDPLLGDDAEPGGGILVDQNGNVVWFEIRVNRTEWEFIVNQNDYWQTGASLAPLQQNVTRDYNEPPGQTPGAFPAALVADGDTPGDIGVSEIKSAWKQLTPAEVASGTFFTRTFFIYNQDAPSGQQCVARQMGLVGMHILYMPALFGNPEWIWATFEHRMNVPTAGINQDATEFSFNNPDCAPVKTPSECAAYVLGTDDPEDFKCCPNLDLYKSTNLTSDPVPNQVTRIVDPSVSTILPTNCTEHYINAVTKFFGANNVWKNYFLVSTQWPLRGASTNFPFYEPANEANFPCTMRNTVLETFNASITPPSLTGCTSNTANPYCRHCNGDCVATQDDADVACPGGDDSTTQYATADCMGCHGMYAETNSSFIFDHRPCCVLKDGDLPNTCGTILDMTSCNAVSACTWVSTDPNC